MSHFSFLCKECKEKIKSDGISGEECRLDLLQEGTVIQTMAGEYDSHGGVFLNGTQRKDFEEPVRHSIHWECPKDAKPGLGAWSAVCEIIFSQNESNGISAVHKTCDVGKQYVTRSQDFLVRGDDRKPS